MEEVAFVFYFLFACSIISIVLGVKSKDAGPWRYAAIIIGCLMLLGLVGCLCVGHKVADAIH
jgi:hypothetical protein